MTNIKGSLALADPGENKYYVQCYDIGRDELFQCVINAYLRDILVSSESGFTVRSEPFPHYPFREINQQTINMIK